MHLLYIKIGGLIRYYVEFQANLLIFLRFHKKVLFLHLEAMFTYMGHSYPV